MQHKNKKNTRPTPAQVRQRFWRLAGLAVLAAPRGHYERVWTPLLTLWYFIWQQLQPHPTLAAVVTDARRGGADRLAAGPRPLSRRIKSRATTSYCLARQRLPLAWVRDCFQKQGQQLRQLAKPASRAGRDWPVELLDGSTKRLRPYGDLAQAFPPQHPAGRKNYWCAARILVSFCATTGLALGALMASHRVSEQALAVQLMLAAAKPALYVGDRNFGVWRVARAARQSGGHLLARLTQARARKLFGKKRLPRWLDAPRSWQPSAHDQVDAGLAKEAVAGRLVIVRTTRPGWRTQVLYLFTTLTDAVDYPPARLLAIYGWRWRAELNFRDLKVTLAQNQSAVKSADLARKEFYAGLMAYNLVHSLMTAASGGDPGQLSFAQVRLLLAAVMTELWTPARSRAAGRRRLRWLWAEAAAARLPRRPKPRPSEPRAQYYEPRPFPKLTQSRSAARRALKKSSPKS